MTRIIAGYASGSVLQVPAQHTRPTSERVREAMFSTLQSWNVIDDAHVLDLFAGSGALGLEAASRGAHTVDLVDVSAGAVQTCKKNAGTVSRALPEHVNISIVRSDVKRWTASATGNWDLVFIDPPYDFAAEQLYTILDSLAPALSPNAMVVIERSTRDAPFAWPPAYESARAKRYGETTVWYGWREEATADE